jgi:hypothetical protein
MDEERLPLKILNWTPTGRIKRGRPESKWKYGVLRAMKKCVLRDGDWEDRFVWIGSRKTLPYVIERLRI